MLLSLLRSRGKLLSVFLWGTMSKLSCTKLQELYRISYSKQRLANSHCSCLQICNLCIHLWGVTVVYWASINHKALWPCYGNMTILLGTSSTLRVCHLPEWQWAINASTYQDLSSDSMELNDLGQDDIFDMGELIPFFMQKKQGSKPEWQKSNPFKENKNKQTNKKLTLF